MPLRAVLHDRKLRRLSAMRLDAPQRWPRVSVLVPAKDEEDTLYAAVQSLLRVDYPELEIILINDRSTDRTGDVVDQLAEMDSRINTLHIDQLPDGWLGKVHALHQGVKISRGEWLLFTDADIHFSPQILKQAIAYCLQYEKGFLALFPDFVNLRVLLGSAQAAFGVMLLSLLNFVKIADPMSKMAMGIGAFNLVKKEFIDPQQGLEWLRMEVADDAGLGLMIKQRGANAEVLSGNDLLRVDWYPTVAAMLDGVLQRLIMGANYSLSLFLPACAFVFFCLVAPLGLSLTLAPQTALAWLCLGAYFVPSIALLAGVKNIGIPRASMWGISIGYAIIVYGMLRSIVTCVRYGGVYWRGSFYALKELRELQRVKMSIYF